MNRMPTGVMNVLGEVYSEVLGIVAWYDDRIRDRYYFKVESGASGYLTSEDLYQSVRDDVSWNPLLIKAIVVAEYAHEFETYEPHD